MSELMIPDAMPVLSRGPHRDPSSGACAMEYISLLAGEEWSDHPSCTHPYLASATRTTNDYLSDDQRHLLVPLIGRLLGTTEDVNLLPWLLANPLGQVEVVPDWSRSGIYVKPLYPEILVDYLSRMIDEYDRLAGRTEVSEVDLPALEQKRLALAAASSGHEGGPRSIDWGPPEPLGSALVESASQRLQSLLLAPQQRGSE